MLRLNPSFSSWQFVRLLILPGIVMGATFALGLLFHMRGEQVTEDQIRERLLNTVSVAALLFDGDMVERVQVPEDMVFADYATLVGMLKEIRELSPHVRFAYIMRRTEDPMMLEFVADADGLSSVEELDYNANGIVDSDEEPAFTGDEYPVDEVPTLQGAAFEAPIVEPEITVDQWGRLLSAYAPITNDAGETVALLGIDMVADELFAITQNTFSLVAVSFVGFLGVFLAAYILVIMRMRRIETLKQLESDRTAMFDLATHQLGAPLATLRWWLEILREQSGKAMKNGGAYAEMQKGIDRMNRIIRAMQEANRLDRLPYNPSSVSLPAILRKTMEEAKKERKKSSQKITLSIGKGIPALQLDRRLIEGVFAELLMNAHAYSPAKSVIGVKAFRTRTHVVVEVADKGCGIPAKDLPRMFEKFMRGSNASKYKPDGNGLGLYIARNIVRRAGGEIRIQSAVAKGTTVSVFFPLRRHAA